MFRLRFCGAAGTVTGSMHLVDTGDTRLLLDCGLYQGRREESRRINREFPFAPRDVHALLLSHAHIDHCGNLPTLVRAGFRGTIWCTPATADLTRVMLLDAAHIQQRDAEEVSRRTGSPVEPLYVPDDVEPVLRLLRTCDYHGAFQPAPGVEAHFNDAGHILGSAVTVLRMGAGAATRRLCFTGDLGHRPAPILRDPEPIEPVDAVISECTYGARSHDAEDTRGRFRALIGETAERGGKVIVPAFSLGRTQTILYLLQELRRAGALPPVPVFVDSPLAMRATEVSRRHPECFDDAMRAMLAHGHDPFDEAHVRYLRTGDESRSLNAWRGPCVIIAASGMCESGRIVHHLKHHLSDPRNLVLIPGFQAEHTLGRRLLGRPPAVVILGDEVRVAARIESLSGLSAHADRSGLTRWLLPALRRARTIVLVHGEAEAAESLRDHLRLQGFGDVRIPARGEQAEVA
jgi:metallo-beta-lactamase family protein